MAGRGVDIKLGGNPATKEEYARCERSLGGTFCALAPNGTRRVV